VGHHKRLHRRRSSGYSVSAAAARLVAVGAAGRVLFSSAACPRPKPSLPTLAPPHSLHACTACLPA
jgi:hypothetical protein